MNKLTKKIKPEKKGKLNNCPWVCGNPNCKVSMKSMQETMQKLKYNLINKKNDSNTN